MEINLKFEYKNLTTKELENWLFRLQGLSGGKIYSISKIKGCGRKELAEEILKTIKSRENNQPIGTVTKIYSYCKKQIKDEVKDE